MKNTYFQQNGAALLMDEVQTGGGATGKFWCHEHFNLESPPDLVTFSKKMIIGGFYYTQDIMWVFYSVQTLLLQYFVESYSITLRAATRFASATLDEAPFYKLTINQVFLSFIVEYGSSGFAFLFIYEYARIIFKLISYFIY